MDNSDLFITLVQEVEKYRFLYDVSSADYSRRNIAEAAWKEIGEKLKLQPSDCKEKWRNIRSSFLRSKKGRRSGRSYYLSPYLQFLEPFMKASAAERRAGGEASDGDHSAEDTADEEPPPEPAPLPVKLQYVPVAEDASYKRRLVELPAHPSLPPHPAPHDLNSHNYYFLLSLLPDLESMSDDQARTFKIEVMMLIDRIKKNALTVHFKQDTDL